MERQMTRWKSWLVQEGEQLVCFIERDQWESGGKVLLGDGDRMIEEGTWKPKKKEIIGKSY